MTKAADKFVDVANAGVKGIKTRIGKHNEKIKKIVKKPVAKEADGWAKAAHVTEKVAGVSWHLGSDVVDLSAAILLRLSQAFVRVSDWIFADNQILDWVEKKYAAKKIKQNKSGKDKKLSKFAKENPRVAAYLTWYLMLMTAIGGGVGVANKDKIADVAKDKIEKIKGAFHKEKEKSEDEDAKIEDISFVASDEKNFAKKAWEAYGNEIIMGLPFFETYRGAPQVHSGEERCTYGPGITWVYTVNANGTINQYPCSGSWKQKAANFTEEEIWEQCKLHCMKDVLGYGLKPAISGLDNLDGRVCVGLCFAGYQAHTGMKNIAKAFSKATTIQEKMDAFLQNVPKKTAKGVDIEEGSLKRRWWCAAYAVGLVSSADFLSLPCDSYSKIDVSMVFRNGHFKYDAETVEYALNKARTKQKQSVADLLARSEAGQSAMQHQTKTYKLIDSEQELSKEDIQIEKSVKELNDGMKKYEAGLYEAAAERFMRAIDLDKDNMEAYSNLSQTYFKLGEKNNSLEYYQKCTDIVSQCNMHMNQNKSRLYDSETKAYTYYNAGHAREEMAKINKANGNPDVATRNYDLALKNYKTARTNAIKAGIDTSVYDTAIARIEKVVSGNTTAFNAGTVRVKEKATKNITRANIKNGASRA